MKGNNKILILRFSALGDVAMTVPVIKCVLQQNPGLHITVASNSFNEPLFENLERCEFWGADLKGVHKGFKGIFLMFLELRKLQKFELILDLHDVIRTKILRIIYRLSGVRTFHIDKGRKEKKQLTRSKHKILRQLKITHQRYADVFVKAGLKANLDYPAGIFPKRSLPDEIVGQLLPGRKLIGLAPFSTHTEKMYPLDKMKNLVREICKNKSYQILFFGSRKEAGILEEWESAFPDTLSVAGRYSFAGELKIISNLSGMVSMDSANVHMACLFGVPVITIWGPTHPFAGFAGWNQSADHFVQLDLDCRPTSIYGNKPCNCHGKSCIEDIPEEMILDKIKSLF